MRATGRAATPPPGDSAYCVPGGDSAAVARALRALLSDAAERGRMGTRGREIATRKFDLSSMLHAYESLYRKLIDSGDGARRR
jgi:glycosyltransferase involved in cell wall biosynthesis